MRNYRIAESVVKFTMTLGCLMIAIGIICVFVISPGGLLIGAALVVSGILMIASSQITLAVIDTAENTARIAEILGRAFPQGAPNRWALNENVVVQENHTKHQVAEGAHRWTDAP